MSLKSKIAAVLLAGCYTASFSYNSVQAASIFSESSSTSAVISANTTAIFKDPSDVVIGNVNGNQQIAVFIEPYCIHCKNYQNDVLSKATDTMPNLRIVLKDLPIFGPASIDAVRIMKAANMQGKYLDMQKLIHELKEPLPMPQLLQLAQQIPGIDIAALTQAVNSAAIKTKINNTLSLAKKLGIDGTPAVIVGTQKMEGKIPLSDLADALNVQD